MCSERKKNNTNIHHVKQFCDVFFVYIKLTFEFLCRWRFSTHTRKYVNASQVDFDINVKYFQYNLVPKKHRPVLQGFHALTEHSGDIRGIPC